MQLHHKKQRMSVTTYPLSFYDDERCGYSGRAL